MLSLDSTEVSQINPFVYDKVLSNIFSMSYVGVDPAGTIRVIMEVASPYIPSFSVERVLQEMVWSDNLEGLDAV